MRTWRWTGKRAAQGWRKSGLMGRKVSVAGAAWRARSVPASGDGAPCGARAARGPYSFQCLRPQQEGAPPSAGAKGHVLSHQPLCRGCGRPGWVAR